MSERVPGVEDIRQALRGDGWTLDEADEGIDRIKRRGIGIGHEMARETMQASIGDAVRKLQAIAWDEGFRPVFCHQCEAAGECQARTPCAEVRDE